MASLEQNAVDSTSVGPSTIQLAPAITQGPPSVVEYDVTSLAETSSPLFTTSVTANSDSEEGAIVFSGDYTPFMHSASMGSTKLHHLSRMFGMFTYEVMCFGLLTTKSSLTGAKFILAWTHYSAEEFETLLPNARVTAAQHSAYHTVIEPSNQQQSFLKVPWIYDSPRNQVGKTYGSFVCILLHQPVSTAESGTQSTVHLTGTVHSEGPFKFFNPTAPRSDEDDPGELTLNSTLANTSPDPTSVATDVTSRAHNSVEKFVHGALGVITHLVLMPRANHQFGPYDVAQHLSSDGKYRGGFRTLAELCPEIHRLKEYLHWGVSSGNPNYPTIGSVVVVEDPVGGYSSHIKLQLPFKAADQVVLDRLAPTCRIIVTDIDGKYVTGHEYTGSYEYDPEGLLKMAFDIVVPDPGEFLPINPLVTGDPCFISIHQVLEGYFGDTREACIEMRDAVNNGDTTHQALWFSGRADNAQDILGKRHSVAAGNIEDIKCFTWMHPRHAVESVSSHGGRNLLAGATIYSGTGDSRGFWSKVGHFFTGVANAVIEPIAHGVATAIVGARASDWHTIGATDQDPQVVYGAADSKTSFPFVENFRPRPMFSIDIIDAWGKPDYYN